MPPRGGILIQRYNHRTSPPASTYTATTDDDHHSRAIDRDGTTNCCSGNACGKNDHGPRWAVS